MSATALHLFVVLGSLLALSQATPVVRVARQADNEEPMPYEFNWEVNDPETPPNGLFANHEEKAEESNPGRTDGMYQVWFEDGRLMTVTYYVEGDSGFVPTVTFEENANPL